MQIGSVITWLDGQQTRITNQAEIAMIQWCMWEVSSIDGVPAGGDTPRP